MKNTTCLTCQWLLTMRRLALPHEENTRNGGKTVHVVFKYQKPERGGRYQSNMHPISQLIRWYFISRRLIRYSPSWCYFNLCPHHWLIIYIDDYAHEWLTMIVYHQRLLAAISVSCAGPIPRPLSANEYSTLSSAIGWQTNGGKYSYRSICKKRRQMRWCLYS